jgi:hypothetical protein
MKTAINSKSLWIVTLAALFFAIFAFAFAINLE